MRVGNFKYVAVCEVKLLTGIVVTRAGLNYVGRVCTVLVGPPTIKND